ncbi:MAG: TIGR04255 family protein [Phycisphaerae bacterium]|nr:TIGR04255 family protein [Phycisphaerae bacterium]
MDSQKRTLPDYNRPPVNEVVLGVQFDTLANFSVVHPGLYWERIRGQYPKLSFHPPVAIAKEMFGDFVVPEPTQPQFLDSPPVPRCWFLDESENRLIQLQGERYHHNWKKNTGEEEYPHYDAIFPEFKGQWQDFLEFVKEESVGEIKLNHWEITYVNHLYLGEGFKDFGELYKMIPFLSYNTLQGNLASPERINLAMSYSYPEELARLHVDISSAYIRSDSKPLIQFRLTARGQLTSNDTNELYDRLDFGHKTIVESFTKLTSSEAHGLWERSV